MKKKLLFLVVAAVAACSFGGCVSSAPAKISSEVITADPWEDLKSLEEAEDAAGFTFELPSDMPFKAAVFRESTGMDIIELQSADGDYVRKGKDDGDISGDYNEYKVEKTVAVGDIKADAKGDEEDSYKLVTWNSGNFSYALGVSKGLTESEVQKLVENIK